MQTKFSRLAVNVKLRSKFLFEKKVLSVCQIIDELTNPGGVVIQLFPQHFSVGEKTI